jgi:ATP-dependent 26S proteasome regulatory subunit
MNPKNEQTNSQHAMKSTKTLLQNIERIIELAESSKLNDEFYKKAKSSINFVAKAMNLTANQAVIFSLFIEKSDDNCIRISDLSGFLGCRNIKTIIMMNDIDELEKRRLVRCCRTRERIRYRVPIDVINAVKQNVVYQPKNTKNINTHELFNHIARLFDEKNENELSQETLLEEFNELLNDNPSLTFCRQMKEFEAMCGSDDYYLLLFFCHSLINKDDDDISFYDMDDIYDTSYHFRHVKSTLREGSNLLIEKNIIEYRNDNGFEDKERFKLTTKAKEALFPEIEVKTHQAKNKKNLVLHKDITPKQLYYNEREKSQIEQLSSLLNKENFIAVQENLQKNGMRKGFAAIFYGAPGTGKTETVYQIAHATGRDIMNVDISQTKSFWFGESEKLIKEVFEKYRALVKNSEIAPILLFNEADGVIGKRKDSVSGSVAQTENAIQNIILQEMENLDGIMIATTNLTQNLDKAFERRFLFKIEFDKPSAEAKEMIWRTMLPDLTDTDAAQLATSYNFSGGQIENITRKYTVDAILHGTKPSIETINNYCKTEFLNKDDGGRKIGFNRD